MDSDKRLNLRNGRILVATFLTLMGVLFTLTAVVFEASPAKWTIVSVAAVMYLGAAAGFFLAFKNRK